MLVRPVPGEEETIVKADDTWIAVWKVSGDEAPCYFHIRITEESYTSRGGHHTQNSDVFPW